MKVLIIFVALVALASAAPHLKKPRRDMSKFQDRSVLYPGIKPKRQPPPRKNHPGNKVVGGSEAPEGAYPFQVSVEIDGAYFCGGSIIGPDHVLTAGHCCDGSNSIVCTAGAHDLNAGNANEQARTSNQINTHENYNNVFLTNDVCVVRVSQPFNFNARVARIGCSRNDPAPGAMVTIVGWGKPSDAAGGINPILKHGSVPVITNAECQTYYGAVTVNANSICTGVVGSPVTGTCNGDSGGPLVTAEGTTCGVTSFVSSSGCQSGLPDGFARVSGFLDWINSHCGNCC